jgi:hypothetical protein
LQMIKESGYFHLQGTKPDTVGKCFRWILICSAFKHTDKILFVGVSLNDSPLGLLAYIGEKFSTWTNNKVQIIMDFDNGLVWYHEKFYTYLYELFQHVLLEDGGIER